MRRGVPLHSAEGRALVNRGPAWREHPDYYRDEPDEIPWHTEEDVALSVARMKNYAAGRPGLELITSLLVDEDWANLARVALGMRPR